MIAEMLVLVNLKGFSAISFEKTTEKRSEEKTVGLEVAPGTVPVEPGGTDVMKDLVSKEKKILSSGMPSVPSDIYEAYYSKMGTVYPDTE